MDATIILERPKLAPHLAAIRDRLASVLAVTVDRERRAKTNEGVDAVAGRSHCRARRGRADAGAER
jgi:2C-methyl-D-erythritol 2,4-cyclodiphosphate synthase